MKYFLFHELDNTLVVLPASNDNEAAEKFNGMDTCAADLWKQDGQIWSYLSLNGFVESRPPGEMRNLIEVIS